MEILLQLHKFSRVMCMKHESMHLYFFRVSLVVLNYKKRKKKQGLNWFTLESRGQDVSIQRPEDA